MRKHIFAVSLMLAWPLAAAAQTPAAPAPPMPPAMAAMPGMAPAAPATTDAPSTTALKAAMDKMQSNMAMSYTGDADADFVAGMVPHHQGAVDMAEAELKYGHDPKIRDLAARIVSSQTHEISMMQKWQAAHAKAAVKAGKKGN